MQKIWGMYSYDMKHLCGRHTAWATIFLDLHASKMKKGKLVDLKDSVFLSPQDIIFLLYPQEIKSKIIG